MIKFSKKHLLRQITKKTTLHMQVLFDNTSRNLPQQKALGVVVDPNVGLVQGGLVDVISLFIDVACMRQIAGDRFLHPLFAKIAKMKHFKNTNILQYLRNSLTNWQKLGVIFLSGKYSGIYSSWFRFIIWPCLHMRR